MTLSFEQENAAIQALHTSGLLAKTLAMQEKFAQFFDLNNFNAIHSYYDAIIVNSELEGLELETINDLYEEALEVVVTDAYDAQNINAFLLQFLASELPQLYNFLKARCFIDAMNEVVNIQYYPIQVTFEGDPVVQNFKNPVEYYKYEIDDCKAQFIAVSTIDSEIDQYTLNTLSIIEKLEYKSIPLHDEL